MHPLLVITLAAMFGACVGFITAALCCAGRGN